MQAMLVHYGQIFFSIKIQISFKLRNAYKSYKPFFFFLLFGAARYYVFVNPFILMCRLGRLKFFCRFQIIGLERKSCPIENNIYLTNKNNTVYTLRNVSKTSFVRGSEMLKTVTFKVDTLFPAFWKLFYTVCIEVCRF